VRKILCPKSETQFAESEIRTADKVLTRRFKNIDFPIRAGQAESEAQTNRENNKYHSQLG
jgi:hypothetical protein